jgi:hypothetical protein
MENYRKIELNKTRLYEGHNSLYCLAKTIKTNKNLTRVEHNGKSIKIFSDKQYKVVETLIK